MILKELGDEVQGARILCIYQKRSKEQVVPVSGHRRGKSMIVWGSPTRAIIEKPLRYKD